MVKRDFFCTFFIFCFRNFNRGRKWRELRHSSWRQNLRVWRWEQETAAANYNTGSCKYSNKSEQHAIFAGAWKTRFWNWRFVFGLFYFQFFISDKDSIPNSPTNAPPAPVNKLELHAKSWKVKKSKKTVKKCKNFKPKVKTARQIRAERFHAEQKRKAFAAENAKELAAPRSGANSPQEKSEAKESQVQTRKPRFPGQFRKPSVRPFAPKPAGPSANRFFNSKLIKN